MRNDLEEFKYAEMEAERIAEKWYQEVIKSVPQQSFEENEDYSLTDEEVRELSTPQPPLPDNVILLPTEHELWFMEYQRNSYLPDSCICLLYDFATRRQIDILIPEDYYE